MITWKRVKPPEEEYDSYCYYFGGGYRIDPEIAMNARSYHPKPCYWRVYLAPEGQLYGGTEIGVKTSLKAAKALAEAHASKEE